MYAWGFPGGASVKKTCLSMQETEDVGLTPGWGRSLVEDTATHSRILTWRTSWTEEPGGLQSMGSHRAGHG